MRWQFRVSDPKFTKRVQNDVLAILTELLHVKSCRSSDCQRCAPAIGNTAAEKMFDKRYKDLLPGEKREYHANMGRRATLARNDSLRPVRDEPRQRSAGRPGPTEAQAGTRNVQRGKHKKHERGDE